MSKPKRIDSQTAARNMLKERWGFYRSWAAVADELGFAKGTLNMVANGKRRANARLLARLGLPNVVQVEASVCLHCNRVHPISKRCPPDPSRPRKQRRNRKRELGLALLGILHG